MKPIFYDQKDLRTTLKQASRSIFLAGPTSASVPRTPWRAEALELLKGFDGVVVLPEFEDIVFKDGVRTRYCHGECPVQHLAVEYFNVLDWETVGIEQSTAVLFWMPFGIGDPDDPDSLPGFTTRCEVARELTRDSKRIVLGMPPRVLSDNYIRFHAHRVGVHVHETLEDTVKAAIDLTLR